MAGQEQEWAQMTQDFLQYREGRRRLGIGTTNPIMTTTPMTPLTTTPTMATPELGLSTDTPTYLDANPRNQEQLLATMRLRERRVTEAEIRKASLLHLPPDQAAEILAEMDISEEVRMTRN